jgi:hypothetical protein
MIAPRSLFVAASLIVVFMFGSPAFGEVPSEWRPKVVGGSEARVAVAAPTDERFAHLSWPKAHRAPDGTIVLAYTAGVFHGDHGGGSPAISLSTDQGRTFSPPQVLREFDRDHDYTQSGNLAIGTADDGALVLLAMAYTGGRGGIVGTAGVGNNIYGWRSTDNGRTWTPTDTSTLGPNKTGSVFGRLVDVPGQGLTALGHYRAPAKPSAGIWLAQSKDQGRTWGEPRQITEADTAEPVLVVTENRWLAFLRGKKGNGRQYVAHSDDAGKAWTAELSELAPPPNYSLAAPFATVNPADPSELLVLTNERSGTKATTPSTITLWRGKVADRKWARERVLVEMPKSADNPNKDLGYPWLLYQGDDRWQLYFYYGLGRGECALWVADVTIPAKAP